MSDRFLVCPLPNGLTLLAEKMYGVRSAAMTIWVAAGSSNDPVGATGSSTVLGEWMLRGAGSRDSRALTDHLDTLGLQRASSASVMYTRFGCSALSERVLQGLDAYADILRRPHLPVSGFEPARELALQALSGIDDEPRQKLMINLRETYWPYPMGRNPMGVPAELEALTPDALKMDFHTRYTPHKSIISLAGDIDLDDVKARIEQQFGTWTGGASPTIASAPSKLKYSFSEAQTEQTHIGIACDLIPETHEDYYLARLAIEVLSGGMSGRLFTEVREKRGLCYSVSASYASLPNKGAIMAYAGTSNERAQQTLDQVVIELQRMADGITLAELDRAKTCLKSSTIMSGESTSARAGAIAYDYFMRSRIRSMEEILLAIDSATLDQVNAFLKRNRAENFTFVLVGPRELQLPV